MTIRHLLLIVFLFFFYFNPFFLKRKFDDETDRGYIEMLWKYRIPIQFYNFIYRNENFVVLNKLSLKYQIAFELVKNFILEDGKCYELLKKYF